MISVVCGLALAIPGVALGSWGVAAGLFLGQGAGVLITALRGRKVGLSVRRTFQIPSPGLMLLVTLASSGLAIAVHRLHTVGLWPPAGLGLVAAGLAAAPLLFIYLWRSGDLAFLRSVARAR